MNPKYKSAYAVKKAAKKSAPRKKLAPRRRMGKKLTKRGIVSPTKIVHKPGSMTESLWLQNPKQSKVAKAITRITEPCIRTDNGTTLVENISGHYAMHSIQHMTNQLVSPMFGALPGSLNPSEPSSGPRRLVLENYISATTLVNCSTVNTQIELYDLSLRQDLPNVNVISIAGSTYGLPGALPEYYVMTGLAEAISNSSTVTPPEALDVGLSIFDSKLFTDYFKVVKRTIVDLAPGASHVHTVKVNAGMVLDENLFGNASTFSGRKQLACYTLILSRPAPTRFVNPEGDITGLSIPPVPVRVMQTRRFKFSYAQSLSMYRSFAGVLRGYVAGDQYVNVNSVSGNANDVVTDRDV